MLLMMQAAGTGHLRRELGARFLAVGRARSSRGDLTGRDVRRGGRRMAWSGRRRGAGLKMTRGRRRIGRGARKQRLGKRLGNADEKILNLRPFLDIIFFCIMIIIITIPNPHYPHKSSLS